MQKFAPYSSCRWRRQQVWDQIWARWGAPQEAPPDARALQEATLAGQAANKASLVHKLDLFCRQQLTQVMQQTNADKVQPLADS